jgi:hypothetical protein
MYWLGKGDLYKVTQSATVAPGLDPKVRLWPRV